MARRRPPLLWLLAFLGLLVALVLFLDLQRFLPGRWPGGGGSGGSRLEPAGAGDDPSRLRPGTPLPPARGRDTLLVVVATPEGAPATDASVMLRRGGVAVRGVGPRDAGAAPAGSPRDGALGWAFPSSPEPIDGIEVTRGGRRWTHGPTPPGLGAQLRVAQPRGALPTVGETAPSRRTLRVVDDEGQPVAGAQVSWTSAGREARATTASDGTVAVGDLAVPQFRVCATAAGHGETCAYGSVAAPGPLVLVVPRTVPRRTAFTDPDTGAPIKAVAMRLVGPDGVGRTVARPDEGFPGLDLTVPADLAAGGYVDVEAPGRPVERVRLATLAATTPIPRGRSLAVRVAAPDGRPVVGATVSARYAPGTEAESGDAGLLRSETRTDEQGRATVPLPADRPAQVVVEAADLAATGFRVDPSDVLAERDVRVEAGVRIPVVVRDEEGRPVAGARVVCLARAGEAATRRVATTDAHGEARLPPVAEGGVEVFAHAQGFAWATTSVQARAGVDPVVLTLARGARLHLVVEDPYGVPVPDVTVRSVPVAGARRQAPDASDPDAEPWKTDADGVLTVEDLPDREMDLYLHAEGFADEVVPRVAPGDATWFATLAPRP